MLKDIIQSARGLQKADLLLLNANVVNVYSLEIINTNIAILGDVIVGLGEGYEARKQVDLNGMFVSPGFIDAHVHIESSMVEVPQFTRAVLPLGTTCLLYTSPSPRDPH